MYKMTTNIPTQKVAAGALAGAIVTLLIFIMETLFPSVDMTESVAAALTTLTAFALSYNTPPGPQDEIVPVPPTSSSDNN